MTRVEYLKHGPHRNFAIVDAAMNDLLRPALYDAWHEIVQVTRRSERTGLRGGGRFARPATFSAAAARLRSPRATCSPSCRPELTEW
jgi:hypothetical protein